MKVIIFLFISFNTLTYSQVRNREKFISIHIGEPIYVSYSQNLFKIHNLRIVSGFGTPDLIGFQDYSTKYNDRRLFEYYNRSIILINNTYLQYVLLPIVRSRLNVYCNGGLQTRMILRFSYIRHINMNSNTRHYMNVPTTTLIEFLPFIQLGIRYQSPGHRFIFGANAGVAKNVFPIIWKIEPLMDVYWGINIAKRRKLTE